MKMAQAAKWAGAAGIRANSPEQIRAIKAAVDLPLIGLYKIWHDDTDVFITPTLEAARQVWEAGAEIIALDCTKQVTHESTVAWDLLPIVKREIPEAIIFADVSNYEETEHAVKLGADIVGPTLYGYTAETASIESPDLREFARMCRDFGDEAYMIMEGHIYTPEDAIKCLYLGAHAVVVGSAITRPAPDGETLHRPHERVPQQLERRGAQQALSPRAAEGALLWQNSTSTGYRTLKSA